MNRKIKAILFSVLIAVFLLGGVMPSSALLPAAVEAQESAPTTWNTFFGGVGTDTPYSTVVDADGNIYVAGMSPSTWASVTPLRAHSAGEDAFVARFDASGALQWLTFLGGSGNDRATDIALDDLGNIYVAGSSSTDWGSDPDGFLPPIVKSGVSHRGDVFVAQLSAEGELLWNNFTAYGASSPHLVSDLDGNTYLTGATMVSWGEPLNAWNGNVVDEVYVVKLDSSGSLLWHTLYGGGFGNRSTGIALHGESIYLTGDALTNPGWNEPRWRVNSQLVSPVDGNPGHLYAFAARLDTSGSLQWYTFPRDSYNQSFQHFMSIALDSSGDVFTVGPREIVKINHTNGNKQWSKGDLYGFGVPTGDIVWAQIAVDRLGNIYTSGTSAGTWGHPATPYHGGAVFPFGTDEGDAFAAMYDSQGILTWNTFLGGASSDAGAGLALSPIDGMLILTGRSYASWGSPVSAFNAYGTPPAGQGFLAKISTARKPPVVMLHGYLGANDNWSFNCQQGIARFDGTQYNPTSNPPVNNPGSSTILDMPGWFEDAGYEVWIGHYTTSKLGGTPAMHMLAGRHCLKKQFETVGAINPNPITIVSHSMGGVLGRLVINQVTDPNVKIMALYSLGSPQAGVDPVVFWGASSAFDCASRAGFCELTEDNMAQKFNPANHTKKDVKYIFIGGSADLAINQRTAVGLRRTTNQFDPLDWPSLSIPDNLFQLWTDETHSEENSYLRKPGDGEHSDSFNCIQAIMHDQEPGSQFCSQAQVSTLTPTPTGSIPGLEELKQMEILGGHLTASASVYAPLDVDGNGASVFNLYWSGNGTPVFTLTRPDNQVIDPQYALDHPAEVTYQVIPATNDMPPSAAYHFDTTQTGTWQLNISSATDIDYWVYGLLESPRSFTVETDKSDYHPGDIAEITAHLDNDGTGLTGATVTADLTRADSVVDTIPLVDQADGSYTATYTVPNVPGMLVLEVVASGSDNGTAYSRQQSTLLGIASNDLQLTNIYSESPNDANGDGLYEKLDFNIGIDLAAPGTYAVSADLYSGGQLVTFSGNSLDLAAGVQTVTLSFDGVEIREAGLDGPYTITNLNLTPEAVGIVSQHADNVLTTAAYTYTQFGKITPTISGNTGAPGVVLEYVDGWSRRITSDEDGDYSFSVPYHWSGTVIPYKTGYAITPADRDYTDLQANQVAQDYTATAITYTLSGNTGAGGVTLTYAPVGGAPQTITSESNGDYSLTLPFGWYGRVTPSLAGTTFAPGHISYNLFGDQTDQDYTAVHTISGNAGIAGATVRYDDGGPKFISADAGGEYTFIVPHGWSGTVVPVKTGYTFTPASLAYTNLSANQAGQDYTAEALTVDIPADPGSTSRLSVSESAAQGNGPSTSAAISANGRYVVFASPADTLVSGDANAASDIFLRDLQTGSLTLVSVDANGQPGNDYSGETAAISADGRFVAFLSEASDLVSGDTNTWADVFLHDMHTHTTTRISVDSNGQQGNGSSGDRLTSISADGRYVVYISGASNLVSGDTNGLPDAFMRDTYNGTTTRISVATGGAQANDETDSVSVSADGHYVAFASYADNLVVDDTNGDWDVFLRDTQAGTTERISLGSSGAQGDAGSGGASISADGRYIAFASQASNLVSGDTNGMTDIFLRDTQTGTTTRLSLDSNGMETDSHSSFSSISANGRYVVFQSFATNLVPGDTNAEQDIFLRDTLANTTTRLSLNSNGMEAEGGSHFPAISADGRYAVFISYATDLVSGDTNGDWDVFLHENGFVISGNAGAEGVSLSYVDEVAKTATSGPGGDYSLTVSQGWSGTVTPSLAGYAFTPEDRSYSNLMAGVSAEDYTATLIDTTEPTVSIDQAAGQVDPTNNGPINFAVEFSELVTGFATGDVTLGGTAGGTLTGVVTGSGSTYNVAVSGMTTNGTVTATIAAGVAQDAAANGNTASTSTDNTVTWDGTVPSVTINQAGAQADPTTVSPINFTVVFSEALTSFATGDVTLSGTAGATTAVVTGSGTTYNVAVSGMAAPGTVIASIPAGVAPDAATNGNTASTSTDNTVTIKANTVTTITTDTPDPSSVSQSFAVNYTVVATLGTPTGNVTVSDGVNSCVGTVAAGTCNITLTTLGARTLTATYPASGNFNGSNDTEAHAVGITMNVNTLTDELNTNGNCSLREAVRAANTNAVVDACPAGSATIADIIKLATGTYNLTRGGADDTAINGDLDITGSVRITGTGAANTIISGLNLPAPGDRIFQVLSGTVQIESLTVKKGKAAIGAGIHNAGTLTLNNVTVTENASTTGASGTSHGAGIYNTGTLTLNNSTVSTNTAISGSSGASRGGGIHNNSGTLTLNNSTVTGNQCIAGAFGTSQGGGIYSTGGSMTLNGSTVTGNTVTAGVGGSSAGPNTYP